MQGSRNEKGSAMITRATRREETTLRLGGHGDNWHMTWAADDTQLVALCDGAGWPDDWTKLHNTHLYRLTGEPADARFESLAGYPDLCDPVPYTDTGFCRYYGFGTLALGTHVYQFLSTSHQSTEQGGAGRFVGAKLIYSADGGRTWCNQDGSAPVAWEPSAERSRENMVFFEEPQEAFSLLAVLQMGRDYADNSDGYVYVYAPNGNTEGTMNQLVMFRVRRDRLLDRSAYEYFGALRPDGTADWTAEIEQRGVVHTFPSGWVNEIGPYAWHPSVAYDAPLGLYLMANWGMGCSADGDWFGKPSYLGLWSAPEPWGPWTQFHEDTAWRPAGDEGARAYQPQIAPKWIAPDGRSFWLVWTDFQNTAGLGGPALAERIYGIAGEAASVEDCARELTRLQPRYCFNAQRVDLTIA
jgi:hypothetical protein